MFRRQKNGFNLGEIQEIKMKKQEQKNSNILQTKYSCTANTNILIKKQI